MCKNQQISGNNQTWRPSERKEPIMTLSLKPSWLVMPLTEMLNSSSFRKWKKAPQYPLYSSFLRHEAYYFVDKQTSFLKEKFLSPFLRDPISNYYIHFPLLSSRHILISGTLKCKTQSGDYRIDGGSEGKERERRERIMILRQKEITWILTLNLEVKKRQKTGCYPTLLVLWFPCQSLHHFHKDSEDK